MVLTNTFLENRVALARLKHIIHNENQIYAFFLAGLGVNLRWGVITLRPNSRKLHNTIVTTVNSSEHLLLQTLSKGAVTTFEMLFRTYYEPLCNYAYSFLRDKEDAEEVVQSTFLLVWEKRETLEIRTSLKSYLYAMVRNACLNVLKHQKIRQRHEEEETALAERSRDAIAHTVAGNELEQRIQEAVEQLPEQCRMVFKLSRFEELKYSEIAEQLNISVKTVENHMGKALRIMRERLKEYLPVIILSLTCLN